ncbi:MarR family winged helix-turn-helix transcriptional regulator [Frondihabitans cladoniiphilus]|uniref:MarR family transcriptional regulator n=1 Tax=Frondihabitans cladoniiphilus TaxID=715785 RepID=A0ABP8VXY3_9MICO
MTTPPVDLRELGRAVKQAQWRHHRALEKRLAPLGTTLAQWDALRAIDQNAGCSGHDLAQITFMSDQAFGTLASRLLLQGLIARSPGQGRRVEYRLTESGVALLTVAQAVVDELLEELFGGLDEGERVTLLSLLQRS